MIDIETTRWLGQSKLTPGHHVISFHFDYAGRGFGKGGSGTLSVDGKTVATNKMEHSIPSTMPWFEGLDVGADYSTPVDSMYQSPNKFTGTINAVTFHTNPMQLATQAQRMEYARGIYNAAMGIQ